MDGYDVSTGPLHHWAARALVAGSKQGSIIGVAVAFMTVVIAVMGLRLWVRVSLMSGVGLDDYLMLLGAAATFALSAANIVCAAYGMGAHRESLAFFSSSSPSATDPVPF
jgi:hypothetical protein